MISLALNNHSRHPTAADHGPLRSVNYLAVGLLLFAIPVAVALYHDIHRFYLTTVDADFIFTYEALRKNAGLEQRMNDHTGYTYYVLLAWTLKLAKLIGVVPIQALTELPPLDSPNFENVYAPLVVAGRYFSALLSGLFAVMIFFGLKLVTDNAWVATAGALIVATSADLAAQTLMLYPELTSMFFMFAGFLAALLAAREVGLAAAGRLFLAALLVMLGVMAKLHGVLIALGLPVLVLMVAWNTGVTYGPRPILGQTTVLLVLLAAAAFVLPAIHMMATSVAAWAQVGPSTANRPPNGAYQVLIVCYIVVAMVIFGVHRRIGLRELAVAVAALGAGLAAGLYGHLLYHSVATTTAFVNFVEQLYHMGSVYRHAGALSPDSWTAFAEIALRGIMRAVDRRFSFHGPWIDPVNLLNWLAVIGLLVAILRRAWQAVIQAVAFFGLGIAAEGSFSLYSIQIKHLIYNDAWTIMALGTLAAQLIPRLPRPAQVAAAAGTLGLVVWQGVGLMDSKHVARFPIEDTCGQSQAYTPDIAAAFRKYCRS
jgi:hypothetical protein